MYSWQTENLGKRYRHRWGIRHVDLHIEPEGITGLLGLNGAGKSTLIKCLLGLIYSTEGSIRRPNGQIGYLPETTRLPKTVSAFELICHASRLRAAENDDAEGLLAEVGLDPRAWHHKIGTYSKGMAQRAAMAFALAGNPSWLILDEPMSGLDAVGRKRMLEVLRKRHASGCGILMCSHIVPDLVRICDRILILAQGRVVSDISVEEHTMEQAERIEAMLGEDSHA